MNIKFINLPDRWEQRRKCQRRWWGLLRVGRSGSCGRSASSEVSHDNIVQQLLMRKRQIYHMEILHNSRNWGKSLPAVQAWVQGQEEVNFSDSAETRNGLFAPFLVYLCKHAGLLQHKKYILVANECLSDFISCQALPHGCQGALFHLTLVSWQ